MINTKTDRKNLFVNLSKIALTLKLKSLLKPGGGYHLRLEDGKFVPNGVSVGWDAPWVYVQTVSDARCDIYHKVFFNILKMVPSYCRNCWKIVVRPQNLIELFDLYEFQREMGVPCKCGIEKRPTVDGLYGGYFYTKSKEQGLERYKEVRKLVNKHLSPKTEVVLKRYCTEFEIGPGSLGPSDKLPEQTPEEIDLENQILDQFPRIGFGTKQPDFIVAGVMLEWIKYDYQNGQKKHKTFTKGSPLFRSTVKYHKEAK